MTEQEIKSALIPYMSAYANCGALNDVNQQDVEDLINDLTVITVVEDAFYVAKVPHVPGGVALAIRTGEDAANDEQLRAGAAMLVAGPLVRLFAS